MAQVKVYRVGKPVVGNHSEELRKFWGSIDAHRPAGHPARLNAVYAGINAHAMERWIDAALSNRYEVLPHEITVDSDAVLVYNIEAYDHCYSSSGIAPANKIPAYWESAMTLTEWLATHTPEESREWEVVISPESIIKTRPLSLRSVQNLMKKSEVEFTPNRLEKQQFSIPELVAA